MNHICSGSQKNPVHIVTPSDEHSLGIITFTKWFGMMAVTVLIWRLEPLNVNVLSNRNIYYSLEKQLM